MNKPFSRICLLLLATLAFAMPPVLAQHEKTKPLDYRLQPLTMAENTSFLKQLQRARELSATGNPAGAIKILGALCRQAPEDPCAAGDGLYLSAANVLHRVIADLEPETLKLWRLHHQPAAARLVREGKATRNQTLLKQAIARHPATTGAMQACVALGDLALDRGQPWSALNWYQQGQRLGNSPMLRLKTALALAALGQEKAAHETIAPAGTKKINFAGNLIPIDRAPELPEWPQGHTLEGNSWSPPTGFKRMALIWKWCSNRVYIPGKKGRPRPTFSRYHFPKVKGPMAELNSSGPVVLPLPVGLLVRDREGFDLLDWKSGRLLKRIHTRVEEEFDPRQFVPSPPAFSRAERSFCHHDSSIYFLAEMGESLKRSKSLMLIVKAYDLTQNRMRWKLESPSLPLPLTGATFQTGPIYTQGRIILLTIKDRTFHLIALSADTGQLLWKHGLHSGGSVFFRPPAIPLRVREGVIYAATGAGTVTAIEANNGRLLWQNTYPREDPLTPRLPPPKTPGHYSRKDLPPLGFLHPELLLQGDTLYLAPPDGNYLVALNALDGTLRWLSPRFNSQGRKPQADRVIGIDQEFIYLGNSSTGPSRLTAIETRTGKIAWWEDLDFPLTSGLVTADAILLPRFGFISVMEKKAPHRLSKLTLEGSSTTPVYLLNRDPFLIIASMNNIKAFADTTRWCTNADSRLTSARRLAICGDTNTAIILLKSLNNPKAHVLRAHLSTLLAEKEIAKAKKESTLFLQQLEQLLPHLNDHQQKKVLLDLTRMYQKADQSDKAMQALTRYNQLTKKLDTDDLK